MKKTKGVRRCRLCAREEDLNTFYNIFDDNPSLNIEAKITKLLPIVVMPWDPMPHRICHSCIDKLNSFDEFYENSLKAEKYLRNLQPCAPDTSLAASDSFVQVLDSPILSKSPFGLTPTQKNAGAGVEPPNDAREKSPEGTPPNDIPPETPRKNPKGNSKRTLSSFIINELTSSDSIYTCRECFRTFTKESSAITHACVRLEDCRLELGEMLRERGERKSLPPLKIRLFSMKSGLFVCNLCEAPFEDKAELVPHIKGHFEDGGWSEKKEAEAEEAEEEEEEEGGGKQRGKRKGSSEDGEWCVGRVRRSGTKRKRKKVVGSGRRSGKRKTTESGGKCQEEQCDACKESSKEREEPTAEQLEPVENSEDEIEIKFERIMRRTSGEAGMEREREGGREEEEEEGERRQKETREVEEPQEKVGMMEDGGCEAEKMLVVLEEESMEEKSEEVTVLEMVRKTTPTSFSSCVFCDKIFATKGGLIAHQKKHLQGCIDVKFEEDEMKWSPEGSRTSDSDTFYCSICAMMFTSKKTLLEHQQFHMVDLDAIG